MNLSRSPLGGRNFEGYGEDPYLIGNMTTTTSSIISVHARISNVGDQDGSEVVQVYVSPSEQIQKKGLVTSEKSLAGFSKVFVPVGETKDVTIQIGKEELRWYDEESHSWQVNPGRYRCLVGTSAVDIQSELEFHVV